MQQRIVVQAVTDEMQNITLGHLVHEAADRMVAGEENRKPMTNVIKRGALKDEVLVSRRPHNRQGNGGRGAGGAAFGDISRSQPVAEPGSQAETEAAG